MPNPSLTQEELAALIDAIVREAPGPLTLKATGQFRREHDAFGQRLATSLGAALDGAGYAWARRPKEHDALHTVIVAAIENAGSADRVGLASSDQRIRSFSCHQIAQSIMETLRVTGTAVVRRKVNRKAG